MTAEAHIGCSDITQNGKEGHLMEALWEREERWKNAYTATDFVIAIVYHYIALTRCSNIVQP